MSVFFEEDTVAFKDDPSIVGTVGRTWSDLDTSTPPHNPYLFLHKDLPISVHEKFFNDGQLAPGYVTVEFVEEYDGCCLVREDSLMLVDRALSVGDIVKKSLSDPQSGTVISTSIVCGLEPLCSEAAYHTKRYIPAEAYQSTYNPDYYQGYSPQAGRLLHGFAPSEHNQPLPPVDTSHTPSQIQVSAQQLTYCNSYREADFVIYKNWVGRILAVHNEITVRLPNGSVVVVERPEELEEPYWIPGSPSYDLARRLDRAGYYRYSFGDHAQSDPALIDSPYPGQRFKTKKGNLRRGRWKFGDYDPAVPPLGIIVDVRCTQLEVRWLYNSKTLPQPPSLLNSDDLDSGELLVYDRSRLPKHQSDRQLSNASYSPDIALGVRVRFKDPTVAEINYGHTPVDPEIDVSSVVPVGDSDVATINFKRLPRSATQGFDMNVLQVRSTSTKAKVQWQDCSVTEEASVQLHHYLNPDDDEVWPGNLVSWTAKEERKGENGPGGLHVHTIGVVQSVDAAGRMGRVRWYRDKVIVMNEEISWDHAGVGCSRLGNEVMELPLYDIANYESFIKNPGDLVAVLPPMPIGSTPEAHFSWPWANNQHNPSAPHDVCWFGEIIDNCLDGDVVIRLGAAYEAREIKIPWDTILVVAADDGESETDDTSESEDERKAMAAMLSDEEVWNIHKAALDISMEYEGGDNISGNVHEDEEMWTTEDEDGSKDSSTESPVNPPTSNQDTNDKTTSYLSDPSIPSPFSILDSSPPTDHRFIDTSRDMTAKFIRRVKKENTIMQSSLPDGVFVRSWGDRLDLLRILIVGPQGTPYEFAPFVFDLQYGGSFPASPPNVFFHSWTKNNGRINPNLYDDGTICLSLLGTWSGEKNEEWIPEKSTVLQIIVSIMGLVLVKEPYYSKFPA